MNRLWEIRERDEDYGRKYGMRSAEKESEKAYEYGFNDGYEQAMREMHSYGERGKMRTGRY